jgi:hypothetical protein
MGNTVVEPLITIFPAQTGLAVKQMVNAITDIKRVRNFIFYLHVLCVKNKIR